MTVAGREAALSVGLLAATLATVTLFSMHGVLTAEGWAGLGSPDRWREALAFSVPLMAILGAHEMAHYVVARRHGFRLSLPRFIPLPFAFGTMGAVIRLKSLPRSRQALLEMGVAGPIAGAVVAFLLLAVSLPWIGPAPDFPAFAPPDPADVPDFMETAWFAFLFGSPFEQQALIFNDPLVVKLLGTAILGAPPDRYATYHPTTMAAWVGCLLTGINLVPIGQLDGGHVANAVSSRVSRTISRVGPWVAIAGGVWWLGWAVWGTLLRVLRAADPLPVDEGTPLPTRARVLAIVAIVLFLLTFMPIPVQFERIGGAP
jgi:membrane-associated protease RseP (regulator of RpoE activity)